MKLFNNSLWIIPCLVLVFSSGVADAPARENGTFRVLSWNISDDAFVAEQAEFHALLQWAEPDVVLLDEVHPTATREQLAATLAGLRPGSDEAWNISYGESGGRQRCVIASQARQESLGEFSGIVTYPGKARERILALAPPGKHARIIRSLDHGIPVNGAVIWFGDRRLLVVNTDLQCCGDGPESWEELRRRFEAAEIRRLIRQVLDRKEVDGVVFAGDFNQVESTFPMSLLLGPYPAPHAGLIPAEIYHPDGSATWTWDGRGTPFPSDTLDYQMYGPGSLKMHSGFVLDTEKLGPEMLERHGLDVNTVGRTGRHRPLLVEYAWR